jgi:squalene-hopene/tetraprenyl-beta-curcumene cyclase
MANNSIAWMKSRQSLGCVGDWRVYRPFINSGGFAFEYHNSWYPDIDDTQTVVLAMIKADPESIASDCVVAAVEWMLGMQSSNGGWAGFDVDNDKLYLNKIPFSDMGAFCDPATPDVTGGVVEAMGLMMRLGESKVPQSPRMAVLLRRLSVACDRALKFLISRQEPNGSWWGRWACNRLYGTTNVLSGLEYFHGRKGYGFLKPVVERGLAFLKYWQNSDGGWGESTLSYGSKGHDNSYVRAQSTPSQTAWAVSALLAYCPASDPHIVAGVTYLIDTQTQEGHGGLINGCVVGERMGRSWLEHGHTATGFPGHMMLGYEFYSHYFPMMALGRFRSKAQMKTNI